MKSKIVIGLVAIALGTTGAYAASEVVKACCCDRDKMAAEHKVDMPAPAPAPAPSPKK